LQPATGNPSPAQPHAPVRACVVESTDSVFVVPEKHERATSHPHPQRAEHASPDFVARDANDPERSWNPLLMSLRPAKCRYSRIATRERLGLSGETRLVQPNGGATIDKSRASYDCFEAPPPT